MSCAAPFPGYIVTEFRKWKALENDTKCTLCLTKSTLLSVFKILCLLIRLSYFDYTHRHTHIHLHIHTCTHTEGPARVCVCVCVRRLEFDRQPCRRRRRIDNHFSALTSHATDISATAWVMLLLDSLAISIVEVQVQEVQGNGINWNQIMVKFCL